MAENKTKLSTEEVLRAAREENLQHVRELTSMRAHGKILGMDTFSWINPDMNALTRMIQNFPFSVLWLTTSDQLEMGCELNISLHKNLDTLIIYDAKSNALKDNLIDKIETVLCVDSIELALRFVRDKERNKMVFLFTSDEENKNDVNNKFDDWINNLS